MGPHRKKRKEFLSCKLGINDFVVNTQSLKDSAYSRFVKWFRAVMAIRGSNPQFLNIASVTSRNLVPVFLKTKNSSLKSLRLIIGKLSEAYDTPMEESGFEEGTPRRISSA